MRFASLGSGSQGNGTLIEKHSTCLLVDCGFSLTQLQPRLQRAGKSVEDLTAILVTHEHGDHIRGIGVLARKYHIPVWMTPGTASQLDVSGFPELRLFNCHESFVINDIRIDPYPVPHDAREPSQFVFSDGRYRFGMLTDAGCATRHIEVSLSGCDALLLECNHDSAMLMNSAYPQPLKERIGSRHGHLSNEQAGDLLSCLDCSKIQHIVAAHLSEKNNRPYLAQAALSKTLSCAPEWVGVANQDHGLYWREIM